MLKLPNNLRNIRKNHQNPELRSGEKVAELIGVSKQYYYDLETGRNNCRLNIDHINKLTKLFNVTADEILGRSTISDNLAGQAQEANKIPGRFEKLYRVVQEFSQEDQDDIEDTLQFMIDRKRAKYGDKNQK